MLKNKKFLFFCYLYNLKKMINKQNYKIKKVTRNQLHNLFLGSSFNNSSSLSRNYKMQKQKIYKTRNVSLTNHNLSFFSQEQK